MAKFGQDNVSCSFCGKPQNAVAKLIAGTGVYICNKCVDLCVEIIQGLDSERPDTRTHTPPNVQSIQDPQPERRVQLHYDSDADRLVGTLGDEPVEWHLVRWNNVAGHMGTVALEASWTTGDNYVPGPGGWTPSPDYISDFPNIPADLSGTYDGLHVQLHGVFHISDNYQFERGSLVGQIGKVSLEATVLAVERGTASDQTVAVAGTYGGVAFKLQCSIDSTHSIMTGSVDDTIIHLDVQRPSVPREVSPPLQPIAIPGPQVIVSGGYQGPPELLALMIGTLLHFA